MDPEEKEKLRLRRQKQERHEVERGERDPFARKRSVDAHGPRRSEAGGRARHERRPLDRDARTIPVLSAEEIDASDLVVTVTAVHRTEIEVHAPGGTRLLIWKALAAPATPHVLGVGDRVVLEPELEDVDEDEFEDDEEDPSWTLVGRLERRTVLARADLQEVGRPRWLACNVDAVLVAAQASELVAQADLARRANAWFDAAGLETRWIVDGSFDAASFLTGLGSTRSRVVAMADRNGLRSELAERAFLVLGVDEGARHALLEALGLPTPEPWMRVRADAAKVTPEKAKASHVLFDDGALWLDAVPLRTLVGADLKAVDLPHAFAELEAAGACTTAGCSHRAEDGCAVRVAMEANEAGRHAAFVRLLDLLQA